MDVERKGELARLAVLIPRPGRNPDRLSDMLVARGCTVHCKPVIDIVPSPIDGLLPALHRADVVIFISGNAAESCLAALADKSLPETAQLFAVGRATAQILVAQGYPVTYPLHDASSEGLLELPELANVAGKKIVICRGEGGREKLRIELQNRGAEVDYVNLYRREATTRSREEINRLICADRVQVVIVHSGEILSAFLRCLNSASLAKISHLTMLAPGERVAELLRSQGIEQVMVADNALPEKIVATLVHWYTES